MLHQLGVSLKYINTPCHLNTRGHGNIPRFDDRLSVRWQIVEQRGQLGETGDSSLSLLDSLDMWWTSCWERQGQLKLCLPLSSP